MVLKGTTLSHSREILWPYYTTIKWLSSLLALKRLAIYTWQKQTIMSYPAALETKSRSLGSCSRSVWFFSTSWSWREKMVILYRQSKSMKVFQLDNIRTEKLTLQFRSYKRRDKFSLVHSFSHVGIHREFKRKEKTHFKCSGWHPMGCHSAQADLRFCLRSTKINFIWQMHLGNVSTQESSWRRRERKQQADLSSELEEGNLVLPL